MARNTTDEDILSMDIDVDDFFPENITEETPNERGAKDEIANNLSPETTEETRNGTLNTMPSRLESDFIFIKELGRGGFGSVFAYKNKYDHREYAIKRIIFENGKKSEEKALREVKALARCNHKNIIKYFQTWLEEWNGINQLICRDPTSFGVNSSSDGTSNIPKSLLCIQMELCETDLENKLDADNEKKCLVLNERLHIFDEILQGVDYIHKEGLIHRDLKPSNIYKAFDRNWKIGDFGLAADIFIQNQNKISIDKQNVKHTKGAGTRLYMAPEQSRTQKYTKKVDIFSLGLISYELLSIFKNEIEREKNFKQLRKGEFSETFQNDYPTEYSVIKEMISKSPGDRPLTDEIRKRLLDRFKLVNKQAGDFKSEFISNFDVFDFTPISRSEVVFKANEKNKYLDHSCTIKRIALPGVEKTKRAIILKAETLKKFTNEINNKNIIRYHNVWVENPLANWQKEQDEQLAKRFNVSLSFDTSIPGPIRTSYLYIQLEMLERSLEDFLINIKETKILNKRAQLRKDKCNSIFKQIIYALKSIHKKHVHGNLKLDNIFIGTSGIIKVGDFGLTTSTSATQTSAACSSSSSSSINTIKLISNCKEDDIYALGQIYYKLFFVIQRQMDYHKVSGLYQSRWFPDDFEKNFPKEHKFMSDMLTTDPESRLKVTAVHKKIVELKK